MYVNELTMYLCVLSTNSGNDTRLHNGSWVTNLGPDTSELTTLCRWVRIWRRSIRWRSTVTGSLDMVSLALKALGGWRLEHPSSSVSCGGFKGWQRQAQRWSPLPPWTKDEVVLNHNCNRRGMLIKKCSRSIGSEPKKGKKKKGYGSSGVVGVTKLATAPSDDEDFEAQRMTMDAKERQ